MKQCTGCKVFKQPIEFHKDKNTKDGSAYRCKSCAVENAKNHYNLNRDAKMLYQRNLYANNREESLKQKKKYYEINKKVIAEYKKEWAKNYKEIRNLREKQRRDSDVLYRLIINFRTRIRNAIKRSFNSTQKSEKTITLLGCSVRQTKQYLESLFQPGMSWDNYGQWHVDHKYPLSLAKSKEELEKLCHYTNLQPLWAADNIRKSNKFITL